MADLTQARLKELLNYDPETGIFTWRINRCAGEYHTRINANAGDVAGYIGPSGKSNYVWVRIEGRLYGAHSLAWLYVNGEWPSLIDHRNGDGSDNRIRNLRIASKSQNAMNSGIARNNTSGHRGVYYDKVRGMWAAEIRCGNRRYRLGRFASADAAANAYSQKAKALFGEFVREQ